MTNHPTDPVSLPLDVAQALYYLFQVVWEETTIVDLPRGIRGIDPEDSDRIDQACQAIEPHKTMLQTLLWGPPPEELQHRCRTVAVTPEPPAPPQPIYTTGDQT